MNFIESLKTKLLLIIFTAVATVIISDLIITDNLLLKIIVDSVILISFIVLGYFAIDSLVIKKINEFLTISRRVIEKDLNQRVEFTKNDEFKILAESFNDMLHSLRTNFQENIDNSEQLMQTSVELATMADQVNQATEAITNTMKQISNATGEQFENVHLSVLAAQQMADIAQQVASEAQKAANFSSQASQRAKTGENIIQDVQSKVIQLKDTVNDSAEVVKKLGGRSLEIGKIVDVIRGISRQTNLLALNAAIEAARAGEHGRGFSVVADEVRALAEQSTKSAIQIVEMINEIQKETQDAVEAMEVGTVVVEEGTQLIISAKSAFNEITDSVKQTMNTIHEIAAASEEQAASSQEMSSTMQSVAAISKQNVTGANQTATATESQRITMVNLASLSSKIVTMTDNILGTIKRFRIRGGGGL